MKFKKYQHLERWGNTPVNGIELGGEVLVFPKLDGANASIWIGDNGELCCGSRNRELSAEADNAGFYKWLHTTGPVQDGIRLYLENNPTHRLFGEWLVPHSLKTYHEDSWRKFYVFDIALEKEESSIEHEGADSMIYLHFDMWEAEAERWRLLYIPPIARMKRPTYEQLIEVAKNATFCVETGKGTGEGVVIKNYGFKNRFGRTTFAKIVTNEFKEAQTKKFGAPVIGARKMVEEDIVEKFVTKALCEKELAKIENQPEGFSGKNIPMLLNVVFHSLITEEMWEILKKFKDPTINFKTLKHFTFAKVKQNLPQIF